MLQLRSLPGARGQEACRDSDAPCILDHQNRDVDVIPTNLHPRTLHRQWPPSHHNHHQSSQHLRLFNGSHGITLVLAASNRRGVASTVDTCRHEVSFFAAPTYNLHQLVHSSHRLIVEHLEFLKRGSEAGNP